MDTETDYFIYICIQPSVSPLLLELDGQVVIKTKAAAAIVGIVVVAAVVLGLDLVAP